LTRSTGNVQEMTMSPLYKKLDPDHYVRYDPSAPPGSAGEFSIVRADRVPPLVLATQRVRLSATDPRADPGGRCRQAIALAMLDTAERGHLEGDATASVPHLLTLAHLAGDRDAQRTLRLPWAMGTNAAPEEPAAPWLAFAEVNHQRAEELLHRVGAHPAGPTLDDVRQLVVHLPMVAPARLRKARAVFDAAWGGQKLRAGGWIDKIVRHAHAEVSATRGL
jgi:hypothetical protein